ncbi:MAG: gamma-glutamylcyclotransferase [Rhizobiaceae bacterium]|nr:gamma-glutamylcyclotransferase [Rhizobiaceae bacterium]
MPSKNDSFIHHPELREHIEDPMASSFRTFGVEVLAQKMLELGLPKWWYADEVREAMRAAFMKSREHAGDLWVFAYGSLMWDPAVRFDEVRRAMISSHSRLFILKDIHGGRGTAESPGLMAALDVGPGCEGLVFRIAENLVEPETHILWKREQAGPFYKPRFVDATTSQGSVTALTFVANHDSEAIDAGLTRDEQIRFLAEGSGFLGSSLDYLRNIKTHFDALGIHDEEVSGLLRDAEAYIAVDQLEISKEPPKQT